MLTLGNRLRGGRHPGQKSEGTQLTQAKSRQSPHLPYPQENLRHQRELPGGGNQIPNWDQILEEAPAR